MPAKAGIHAASETSSNPAWTPAFAGLTEEIRTPTAVDSPPFSNGAAAAALKGPETKPSEYHPCVTC